MNLQEAIIYVSTYAKHNNGSLSGEWVNLSKFNDYDEFVSYIKELHSDEEYPEFMFQDFENIPKEFVEEGYFNSDFFELRDLVEDINSEAYLAFCDHYGCPLLDSKNDFESSYQGEWESEEAFGEQLFDELYLHNVPDSVRFYIDYDKFTRDLFICDYTYVDGFVFCNNY